MAQCSTGWLPIIFGGLPGSAYLATSLCNPEPGQDVLRQKVKKYEYL